MVDLAHTIHKPPKEPATPMPPLLMIHGLCGLRASWGQLPQEISYKSGRNVITIDLRNHGDSPRTDTVSIQSMADDIVKLLNDLDHPKVIMFGHSLGGQVAQALVLSRPDIVERLIIEEVSPCSHVSAIAGHGHLMSMLMNFKFDHSWPSVEHARTAIKEQMPEEFPTVLKDHYTAGVACTEGRYHWTTNMECISKHLEDLFDFPTFDNSFDGRALFLMGESGYRTDDDAESIQKFFPNAQVVTFECGHWVHIEQKEQCLETVLKFLE